MQLLTLIIPTYNMEKYLDRCLSSLVISDRMMKALEVLVVNDGSQDSSSEIAHGYARKYPDTFRVIDKENGNYGSCINRGLKEARGQYIKIVDADDWFDNDVFEAFMGDLLELSQGGTTIDVVQTPFTCIGRDGVHEVIRYNTMGREPYRYNQVYLLDEILKDGYIRFFLMHGLAYRTEMLRDMEYKQTEGVFYSDTEWACYPFYMAQNIVFLDHNLYQYDAGRDGQSTQHDTLMKSIRQLRTVTDVMIDYYELHAKDASIIRQNWLKQYYENRIKVLYKHCLIDMSREDFDIASMKELDSHYAELCRRNDMHVVLMPENRLIRIDYINYWRKNQKRWPLWLDGLSHVLDNIARFIYIRTARRR